MRLQTWKITEEHSKVLFFFESMDPDITSWILEFVARQPISEVLNKFLTNTHIPISSINNPRFKKTLLLRSIRNEIADGSASSETILESLEAIEELDREQETHITDSMKLAYQAVAVDCTVMWVAGKSDKGQFFDAVKRIWRDRIERLEFLKKSELVTDELRELKEEMEAALWDSNACLRLLSREMKNESLRLVKDYLQEATDKMGPPFLELAAKSQKEMKEKEKGSVKVGIRADSESDAGIQSGVADSSVRTDKEIRENDMPCTYCQGADGTMDSEMAQLNVPLGKHNSLATPEVTEAKEALKSSSLELKAVVKDPLPNAVHVSQALIAEMKRKVLNKDKPVETCSGKGFDVPSSSISPVISRAARRILNPVPSAEALELPVIQTINTNAGVPVSSHQNTNIKRSLMDWNSTACTFEWDDSIDASPDDTDSRMNRLHIKSQKRTVASPLKNDITKFARRRKMKRWSVEEEDALREGVQRLGKGNWKLILNSKPDIFVDRTEVDLKDKWRNMMK